MNLANLINPEAILEMGLSRIKNPQLRASVLKTARKYMAAKNPIQAALADKGLTMGILKREGLPLLREGRLAEQIRKIPGSNFVVSQVENYVNKAAGETLPPDAAHTPAVSPTPTRAGNPFPPLKPR